MRKRIQTFFWGYILWKYQFSQTLSTSLLLCVLLCTSGVGVCFASFFSCFCHTCCSFHIPQSVKLALLPLALRRSGGAAAGGAAGGAAGALWARASLRVTTDPQSLLWRKHDKVWEHVPACFFFHCRTRGLKQKQLCLWAVSCNKTNSSYTNNTNHCSSNVWLNYRTEKAASTLFRLPQNIKDPQGHRDSYTRFVNF